MLPITRSSDFFLSRQRRANVSLFELNVTHIEVLPLERILLVFLFPTTDNKFSLHFGSGQGLTGQSSLVSATYFPQIGRMQYVSENCFILRLIFSHMQSTVRWVHVAHGVTLLYIRHISKKFWILGGEKHWLSILKEFMITENIPFNTKDHEYLKGFFFDS